MSASFKRTLRTKSAEQLINMYRNREGWSAEEHQLIKEEVVNRGLEIFEEPQEWSEEEMESIDLLSPKNEFERNMAFLTKEKEQYDKQKGVRLASQIVAISSVFVSFSFFYLYQSSVMMFGISQTFVFSLGVTGIAIAGLILYVLRKYIASLVVSGLALLFILIVMLMNLQSFL